MTEKQLVEAAAQAVAEGMGYFKQVRRGLPQPVARRLNNPGCLPSWCAADGTPLPTNMGMVEFATPEDGWRALRTQCRINLIKRRLSPLEFFLGRSPIYRGFAPRTLIDPYAMAALLAATVSRAAGVVFPVDRPMIDVLQTAANQ